MAALLLTPANLYSIKTDLRTAFPQVKSSHLSEALAAALGYRTHAALLANIKASPDKYPPLAWTSDEQFARRLHDFGVTDHSVDLVGMARNGIPDRIWRIFARKDRETNNHWYGVCRARGLPNVCIKTGTKYCELEWDYLSLDSKREDHLYDQSGSERFDTFVQKYEKRIRQEGIEDTLNGTPFVGTIGKLSPAVAYDLADEAFAMLYMSPVRAA